MTSRIARSGILNPLLAKSYTFQSIQAGLTSSAEEWRVFSNSPPPSFFRYSVIFDTPILPQITVPSFANKPDYQQRNPPFSSSSKFEVSKRSSQPHSISVSLRLSPRKFIGSEGPSIYKRFNHRTNLSLSF